MTIDEAKKAKELLRKLENLESSILFQSVHNVAQVKAPFLFGHDGYTWEKTGRSSQAVTKSSLSNLLSKEEIDKIEEEYLYFMERVEKIIKKKHLSIVEEIQNIGK